MTRTLLHLVTANANLYTLLKTQPASQQTRNFLQAYLGVTNIPNIESLEEWESWLASRPITLLNLNPSKAVYASQTRQYSIEFKENLVLSFDALLESIPAQTLNSIFSPIISCVSIDEVNNVDLRMIVTDLYEELMKQLLTQFSLNKSLPYSTDKVTEAKEFVVDTKADNLYELACSYVEWIYDRHLELFCVQS